jgi:hypothetical protein
MQQPEQRLKYVWLPIYAFIFWKYQENYDSKQEKKKLRTFYCLLNEYLLTLKKRSTARKSVKK